MSWTLRYQERLQAFQQTYPYMKGQHIAILALWYTEQEKRRYELEQATNLPKGTLQQALIHFTEDFQEVSLQVAAHHLVTSCAESEGYADALG